MEESFPAFRHPPAAYRGKPFWSWNGQLDEAELLRQIHAFKEMGFGGFFMHSRTGLVTDYLGDEWFRLTNRCADEAAKLGMEAWLYDEDRWPSGTAGGLVTANPDFRQQFITLHQIRPADFSWDEGILAAFVATVDGLDVFNCRRLGAGEMICDEKQAILAFRIEHAAQSSFYNGNSYVDTMNRAATQAFLETTHEQYRQRCGERLGKSIHGIFTDEPHRGPVMNGFSLSNDNRPWMTPWTATLPDEFRAAFGYELIDHLPALFLRPEGEAVASVKWQYMELLQRLFLKNFAAPMFDWCNQHGMQLTGHVLHEDSLTAQACMQGSLARFYEFMHIPGIDVLGEGNRCYWVAKQLASVARQLGQKWLLSELYGCTGWQMGFDGHKAVGDWQALLGINVRCHHLSWYTMEGEAKRDYPASISHQSAWWKDYRFVEDYFARMGVLLSHGEPYCSVLVVSPIESLWCQIRGGWAENLAPKDEPIKQLESAYEELFTWLAGGQVEFDYGDEEMMSRLADVRLDSQGRPVLRFGQAEYRTIILGRMTTVRSSTLRLVERFADAGGKVIFVGSPPPYVDAIASTAATGLASKATRLTWNRSAVLNECRKRCDIRVEVFQSDGAMASGLLCQLRRDERGPLILVALNTNREEAVRDTRIRLHGAPSAAQVAEWDCASGQRFSVKNSAGLDGAIEWKITLAPGGSRAFVIGVSASIGLHPRPHGVTKWRARLDEAFRYTLTEPNVCVLDMPRFQMDDGTWQPATEILKVDRAVRSAFGLQWRSGDMVQPWLRRRTRPHPPVKGRVRLSFRFDVAQLPSSPVELALEQPRFFNARINGHALDTSETGIRGSWIDHAIKRIAIPADSLKLGENEIELVTDFHEDVNLEAIYLLGSFGVQVRGSRVEIGSPPATIRPGDLTVQGLPFYGGGIQYHLPVAEVLSNRAHGDRLLLELPKLHAACAKIVADGKPPAMLAWHPYRADVTDLVQDDELIVEVTLTRRNTFGPLHQKPLLTPHYGPENFTTVAEKWSDDFELYPSGLLAAPVLIAVEQSTNGTAAPQIQIMTDTHPRSRRTAPRRTPTSPGV
jgi:hypothetical protein